MDYYLIANRNVKDQFTSDILRWVSEQAKLKMTSWQEEIEVPTHIPLTYQRRPEDSLTYIDTKAFERISDYDNQARRVLEKSDGVIFVGNGSPYLDSECVIEVTHALSLGLSIKTIILP